MSDWPLPSSGLSLIHAPQSSRYGPITSPISAALRNRSMNTDAFMARLVLIGLSLPWLSGQTCVAKPTSSFG